MLQLIRSFMRTIKIQIHTFPTIKLLNKKKKKKKKLGHGK